MLGAPQAKNIDNFGSAAGENIDNGKVPQTKNWIFFLIFFLIFIYFLSEQIMDFE